MQGRIDRDEGEEKLSATYRYGKKFKSFRLGYRDGKIDGAKIEADVRKKCPFKIPSDVYELLKKRARWFAGYDLGWEQGRKRKKKKLKKRRERE